MRFLFIGPGYPGIQGVSYGSGIGTYLHEITLGLTQCGHECHVMVWGKGTAESGIQNPESRIQNIEYQDVNGVRVFLLAHSYWPVMERVFPDARDVFNVRRLAKRLDRQYHYDWIEIQSEEGIGIGVQREFPAKTLLRVHTTLRQMVEYKGEAGGGTQNPVFRLQNSGVRSRRSEFLSKSGAINFKAAASSFPWKLRYRLWRERRSLAVAKRIVTHSTSHAEEIKRLYPGIVEPTVVRHGLGEGKLLSCQVAKLPASGLEDQLLSCQVAKLLSESPASPDQLSSCSVAELSSESPASPDQLSSCSVAELSSESPSVSSISSLTTEQLNNLATVPSGASLTTEQPNNSTTVLTPSFLIVGTADRRKGFDRIWPVLEVYAAKYGPCRVVVVAGGETIDHRPQTAARIAIEWKSGLSAEELSQEYSNATVYLHLARYESFGIPLIEAAAHGLPIVSTRVGIAPELLEGELSRFLVDGDDPVAVAYALNAAGSDRVSIGGCIHMRYVQGFSRETMTHSFLGSIHWRPMGTPRLKRFRL